MRGNKIFLLVMLLFSIVALPLLSVWAIRTGYNIRKNTQPSIYFLTSQNVKLPEFFFISQRGDTINTKEMSGKVVVLDFFSYQCVPAFDNRTRQLFELQEDYYGKTISFRIISVSLTPQTDSAKNLNHYANRYAAREMWSVVSGDSVMTANVFKTCDKNLTTAENANGNYFCPNSVFLIDKQGYVRGKYNPLNKEEFNALYTDVLYLIDQK